MISIPRKSLNFFKNNQIIIQVFHEKLTRKTLLSEFSDDEGLNLSDYKVLNTATNRPPSWSTWKYIHQKNEQTSFIRTFVSKVWSFITSCGQRLTYILLSILFAVTAAVKTSFSAVNNLFGSSLSACNGLIRSAVLIIEKLSHSFSQTITKLSSSFISAVGKLFDYIAAVFYSVPGSSSKLVSLLLLLVIWLCSLPVAAAKSTGEVIGSALQHSFSLTRSFFTGIVHFKIFLPSHLFEI